MTDIDAPPITEKTEKKPLVVYDERLWKTYFKPAEISKILHKKLLLFSIIATIIYLAQFFCCLFSINYYSDMERLTPCVDEMTGETASAVYDLAICLLAIYHIIEWLRCTAFLTVICIGVNLMWVWYITVLNTAFGLVAFIYAHTVRFGAAGKACEEAQEGRANWLLIEIGVFWVFFFVMSFPILIIRLLKKQSLEAALAAGSDDEEEE